VPCLDITLVRTSGLDGPSGLVWREGFDGVDIATMGSILGACRQLSLRGRLLRLLLLLLLRLVAVELIAGDASRLCLGWWGGGRFGIRLDYFEWARLAELLAFAVLVEDFQIDDNENTADMSETVATHKNVKLTAYP
jgi:hypothetical protein